jgi:hypothetical protein
VSSDAWPDVDEVGDAMADDMLARIVLMIFVLPEVYLQTGNWKRGNKPRKLAVLLI